jgi:hypothetical protein
MADSGFGGEGFGRSFGQRERASQGDRSWTRGAFDGEDEEGGGGGFGAPETPQQGYGQSEGFGQTAGYGFPRQGFGTGSGRMGGGRPGYGPRPGYQDRGGYGGGGGYQDRGNFGERHYGGAPERGGYGDRGGYGGRPGFQDRGGYGDRGFDRGRQADDDGGHIILDDRSAEKLSALILNELRQDDRPTVILVKGSRALHLERVVNEIILGIQG